MATILKIVGANIRRMRRQGRLTLEQLAEKAESNPKYLGAVERGEENIGLKKLSQVASALQVEPYELLLPGEEDGITKELIASIKTADQPTQTLLADLAKRIPAWRDILSSDRKQRTRTSQRKRH
ncbi:MAG TPA: helix-turn-helix domain-containing protein [Terriglobia bacterium]|nr:helix-turn-helix domain-containing protein [Terriglobia bacterium]